MMLKWAGMACESSAKGGTQTVAPAGCRTIQGFTDKIETCHVHELCNGNASETNIITDQHIIQLLGKAFGSTGDSAVWSHLDYQFIAVISKRLHTLSQVICQLFGLLHACTSVEQEYFDGVSTRLQKILVLSDDTCCHLSSFHRVILLRFHTLFQRLFQQSLHLVFSEDSVLQGNS